MESPGRNSENLKMRDEAPRKVKRKTPEIQIALPEKGYSQARAQKFRKYEGSLRRFIKLQAFPFKINLAWSFLQLKEQIICQRFFRAPSEQYFQLTFGIERLKLIAPQVSAKG